MPNVENTHTDQFSIRNITIQQVNSSNLGQDTISGIVRIFRDDDVVPWHRYDQCLEWVNKRMQRGFYITIAYNGDTLVGYSEWIEMSDAGRKILYLGIMQVEGDLRGRGIGGLMLSDGEEYAHRIGALHLRTIPEDERAQDFYLKYGYASTDTIFSCLCRTVPNPETLEHGKPSEITLEDADNNDFIFGLSQSSGRHMYEVANHYPGDTFEVKTMKIASGFLQFRYRIATSTAMVLYWSNGTVTADTVSDILSLGCQEGFEEIEFVFRSKYRDLFTDKNVVLEATELEKAVSASS